MMNAKQDHNPDVLCCIANLSNDEVFTPPEIANKMLDLLPQSLFQNPETTFLDPFTKTGVFLREIVKRLDIGLETTIPERQKRIDHILHNQVFGIAITELTALLTRRTLYCSKFANGEHCISKFETPEGNILYEPMKHTWVNGRCKYCGASQKMYDKNEEDENYAYPFIHINDLTTYFNMKFDVICGNPPYHLADGGDAASDAATPVYNKFFELAIKHTPQYITMIMPSKWMVGGRGLQSFRKKMIEELHISDIIDYENPFDCFPGIHIDGGVCYFLWSQKHNSKFVNYSYKPTDSTPITIARTLGNPYSDIIIRDNRRESIIKKTTACSSFSERVSARKPFEIGTDLFNCPDNYRSYNLKENPFKDSIKIYGVKGKKGGAKRVIGYIKRESVTKNVEWIDKYKILISKSYSSDAITPPELILSSPNEVCTETFLVIGPFATQNEMNNCMQYTSTNFFKILLFFGRGTMQVSRDVFRFVPDVDLSIKWTDAMLYKKFEFTESEISFINSIINID